MFEEFFVSKVKAFQILAPPTAEDCARRGLNIKA